MIIAKPIIVGTPCGTFKIDPKKPLKESFEKINDDFMDDSEGVADIILTSHECIQIDGGLLVITSRQIRTLE